MKLLRYILFPLALIYGTVTYIRNMLYNYKWLSSSHYNLPLITVGNLSVGGTGKSPMIEYLLRLLIPKYSVATLSRGYKRKTKGFILAHNQTKVTDIGDEPYQFYNKFPKAIIAVEANRRKGIENLIRITHPDCILLDDAYQHRKVTASLQILLTVYNQLYTNDCMLPTGNLREPISGAQRAQIIIVTKCPPDITPQQQQQIAQQLKLKANQQLYFTAIRYNAYIYSENQKIELNSLQNQPKIALAGIANPNLFFKHIQADHNLTFPDHHNYSETDCQKILQKAQNQYIITTEKDYMRLKGLIPAQQLYYLPIETYFISQQTQFDQTILNYVEHYTTNS